MPYAVLEPEDKPRLLKDLPEVERKHWELHLNAVMKDTPSLSKEVNELLTFKELPNLIHPSDIHDWLEQPDRRINLEPFEVSRG